MYIKEINDQEYTTFKRNFKQSSIYQTSNYANFLNWKGFKQIYVALGDKNTTKCAAAISYKNINGINYGYCPNGYLIDYEDKELLKFFTVKIKDYLHTKKFSFLKIDPNIKIGTFKIYKTIKNENYNMIEFFESIGYKKIQKNATNPTMLPIFTPVINLKEYKSALLRKNTRNKVKNSMRKGLSFHKVDPKYFLYNTNFEINMKKYLEFYKSFHKDYETSIFVVKLEKEEYLKKSMENLNNELIKNKHLNKINNDYPTTKNENKKMNSDIKILALKKELADAYHLKNIKEELIISCALVIKNNNNAQIIYSHYDKQYKRFGANYFLHYALIKYYKQTCNELNINGIFPNYYKEESLTKLNNFKMGFKPIVYENICEFDLIISPKIYNYLENKNLLNQIFKTNTK